jgi:restriction endonuclease S subunit
MKQLLVVQKELIKEERWDFDFHEPPSLIKTFQRSSLRKVIEFADVVKAKKDPTKRPDEVFHYIDIASIDVETGGVARTQELTGGEAPSRARKLVQAYDIIISTCRPTRGAIAVIPEELHGQICSTGFSVVRAKPSINPYYLHFALRLDSTTEQFRKFSTGSSYPAILDSDVEKTLIPVPEIEVQNEIVKRIKIQLAERNEIIEQINSKWNKVISHTLGEIVALRFDFSATAKTETAIIWEKKVIDERISALPPVSPEEVIDDEQQELELEEQGQ